MQGHDHSNNHASPPEHRTNRRAGWIFAGFAVIAGLLLFTEHRAHVLGVLPYLFLLACPLMHLFMHHGHGHHDGKEGDK